MWDQLAILVFLMLVAAVFQLGRELVRFARIQGWWLALMAGLSVTSAGIAGEVEEAKRIADRWEAQTEVQMWDGTRVDILTETTAWEVDWAKPGKHFEAIGQALYYAEVTGKKPGVVLLVTDLEKEAKYVYRTAVVCAKYGITLHVEKVVK